MRDVGDGSGTRETREMRETRETCVIGGVRKIC